MTRRTRRPVYVANDFYGSERVLRQHASWTRPVKAVIPHGVPLNPYYVHKQIVGWPVPYILPYSWLSLAWAEASAKHAVLSAAPFVYLVDAVEPVPAVDRTAPAGRRLLFFPSHSTMAVTAAPSSSVTLRRLAELREDGWDCLVCMYWLDLDRGRASPFEKLGLRVVTCGHRDDPEFMPRLIRLIVESSAVAGEAFGSHMFYAAYLGRPYASLTPPPHLVRPGDRFLDYLSRTPEPDEVRFRTTLPDDVVAAYLRLDESFGATDLSVVDVALQERLAREFLGSDNLLTPAELRNVLSAAERADRFDRNPPPGAAMSSFARRQLQRPRRVTSEVRRRSGWLVRRVRP